MIYSSRSKEADGIAAMHEWLRQKLRLWYEMDGHEEQTPWPLVMADFEFSAVKPPAFLTIDDRGMCFTGNWEHFSPKVLRNFKPWNMK